MAWQDKVVLRYSNAASDKDLEQGSTGQLVWNNADVAMASDLDGKQDSLTTEAGIFLLINGSTIGSYTLRWNGSSPPTVPPATGATGAERTSPHTAKNPGRKHNAIKTFVIQDQDHGEGNNCRNGGIDKQVQTKPPQPQS